MHYIITAPKDKIKASISLPASKSVSNRALIIHALSRGKILPENLSDCDDTEVILKGLRNLSSHDATTIDIGAAGTAMRFMTAFLSSNGYNFPTPITLTGTERMKHRPIKVLVDALRRIGAQIDYTEKEGFPPLLITGNTLTGGELEIPGNVSSQYISALLIIAPYMENGLNLHLTGDIISRPYIDLTLHIMHEFGVKAEWTDIDTISVARQTYKDCQYTIENDWSAASYWYEIIALLANDETEISLPGLMDGSRQGDSAVRYIFSLLGIKTAFDTTEKGVLTTIKLTSKASTITGGALQTLEYDFVNQPDLAQTLIALCPILGIKFHFKGLASLKIKETDRIEAMKAEMSKLGYVLHDKNNSELYWDGERCEPVEDPIINTYEDHRMAMSFAPLAIRLGMIRIDNPHVVSKSYPHYWDDLRSVGFSIIECE